MFPDSKTGSVSWRSTPECVRGSTVRALPEERSVIVVYKYLRVPFIALGRLTGTWCGNGVCLWWSTNFKATDCSQCAVSHKKSVTSVPWRAPHGICNEVAWQSSDHRVKMSFAHQSNSMQQGS